MLCLLNVASIAIFWHQAVEADNHSNATYFEVLRLHEFKVCVSLRTYADLEPDLRALKQDIGFGALVKFEDASISLGDFVLERPFANFDMLYDLIKKHYTQEILRQAYMIVGSVDFLGNPIGIVNNVTDGLKAFVSESATGNLFGGSLSLAKHVTHGLADSASKLTGSISAGLGRATMDREYQVARERRKAAVKDSAGHLASVL